MFTFIGPVHLAIFTHHHHNNIHNNIDNNNSNNTVSATYSQKKSISFSHSSRSGIICDKFVSYSPSNIPSSKGDSVQ